MNSLNRFARPAVIIAVALINSGFILSGNTHVLDLIALAVSLMFVAFALKWPIAGNLAQLACFIAWSLAPGIMVQTYLIAFVALIDLNMRRPSWIGYSAATVVALTVFFVDWSLGHPEQGLSFALAFAFMASVGAMLRSRSETIRSQAELSQLRLLAQRQGIAREMHDVVAYGLSQIVLRSRVAAAKSVAEPEVAAEFAGIADAARASLTEVRLVISLLNEQRDHPGEQESLGVHDVATAVDLPLSGEIRQIEQDLGASRFQALVTSEGDVDNLPQATRFVAGRALRELAANSMRHADPSQPVNLALRVVDGAVDITSSNAIGSRQQRAAFPRSGLGLRGMDERLTTVNGQLRTSVDNGTWTAHVHIPAAQMPPAQGSQPEVNGAPA